MFILSRCSHEILSCFFASLSRNTYRRAGNRLHDENPHLMFLFLVLLPTLLCYYPASCFVSNYVARKSNAKQIECLSIDLMHFNLELNFSDIRTSINLKQMSMLTFSIPGKRQ